MKCARLRLVRQWAPSSGMYEGGSPLSVALERTLPRYPSRGVLGLGGLALSTLSANCNFNLGKMFRSAPLSPATRTNNAIETITAYL